MNGFANVASFMKAFKKAKSDLVAKEKPQEEQRKPDTKPESVYWRVPANAKREPVKEEQQEQK